MFVNNIYNTNVEITNQFVYACKVGDLELFKKLLDYQKVDIPIGNLALFTASKYGQLEIVDLLLKDNRGNPAASEYLPFKSPFDIACAQNHVKVAERLLLDSRVHPNGSELVIANELGNTEIFNLIIQYNIQFYVSMRMLEAKSGLQEKKSRWDDFTDFTKIKIY